jgi:hypothetical protein
MPSGAAREYEMKMPSGAAREYEMKMRVKKGQQRQMILCSIDTGTEETQLRVLETLSGVLKYMLTRGYANRYDTRQYDMCHLKQYVTLMPSEAVHPHQSIKVRSLLKQDVAPSE